MKKFLFLLLLLPFQGKAQDSMKLMLLNAYQFDFGNTHPQGHYTGHLNLFMPRISGRFGLNTGILRINYSQNDSLLEQFVQVDRILDDPLVKPAEGVLYWSQLNQYRTEKRNEVWSFYNQPLYRLTPQQGMFRLWVHAHLELLASTFTQRNTVTLLNEKQDTIRDGEPVEEYLIMMEKEQRKTIQALHGYFGAGVTLWLEPSSASSFFFQASGGRTSNRPSPSSVDINTSVPFPGYVRSWNNFYLVRAAYSQQLNEGARIVVGTEIRGLFPLYAPLYAAYAGLDISLSSLASLLNRN
jgi:hypothetical protein